MIAKRIDMRDASKSRATRLAKYVTDELERAGRVAEVFTTNCISDDVLLAAKEIEICQAKNTRAKDDKTYHLLLSFPDGERPNREQMRSMADAAAKSLGYSEYQQIAVVHDDTDNLHMHLIINKIHPERLTIHTPRQDFKILAELCVKLERDNALQQTNHGPTRSVTDAKSRDMEAHSGVESFLSYAKKKTETLFHDAQSWEQVHSALAGASIFLRLKGNGLALVDHTGTVAVKASTIGRDFSKAKLEKRFGVFVPHVAQGVVQNHPTQPSEQKPSTYQKSPITGSEPLYQQYKREKETTWRERRAQLAGIWHDQKQAMQRIAALAKLDLPKAASYHLKRKLRLQARSRANTAIADIRQTMAKKRTEIKERYKALGYIEWLKRQAEQGNIPAIYALRKRGAVAPAVLNITTRDLRNSKIIADKIAHVTGRGTLFYKARHDIFRDNGGHISLKREVSDAGIHAALCIAMAKFQGQPLTVNGSDAFKLRCVDVAVKAKLSLTFSDIAMEAHRQERMRTISVQRDKEILVDRERELSAPKSSVSKDSQSNRPSRGIGR